MGRLHVSKILYWECAFNINMNIISAHGPFAKLSRFIALVDTYIKPLAAMLQTPCYFPYPIT